MKKILIASFCLALFAPAAQAQNVNTAAPRKEAQPQSASRSADGAERRHGTAGMKNNSRRQLEQAQERQAANKNAEQNRSNTTRTAAPAH